MRTCGALCALLGLTKLGQVRSSCPDVDKYFGSMTSDTSVVDLGQTTRLECPSDEDTEIVILRGQHLTVSSGLDYEEPVKFKNIRFTVEEDASLVFEKFVFFGPNNQDFYTILFKIDEGATVTFEGKFRASKVRTGFQNNGYVEFKAKAFFNNNGYPIQYNAGTMKFRSKATFKNNEFHAIFNTGFTRFSKKAIFIGNGATFDDTAGCGLENYQGTVRFYDKAIFNDNINENLGYAQNMGGGLQNRDGDLIFKGDVEFNRNSAHFGGGMGVIGGEVEFREAVSFTDNEATSDGGGFAVLDEGVVTFTQPDQLTASGNNPRLSDGACVPVLPRGSFHTFNPRYHCRGAVMAKLTATAVVQQQPREVGHDDRHARCATKETSKGTPGANTALATSSEEMPHVAEEASPNTTAVSDRTRSLDPPPADAAARSRRRPTHARREGRGLAVIASEQEGAMARRAISFGPVAANSRAASTTFEVTNGEDISLVFAIQAVEAHAESAMIAEDKDARRTTLPAGRPPRNQAPSFPLRPTSRGKPPEEDDGLEPGYFDASGPPEDLRADGPAVAAQGGGAGETLESVGAAAGNKENASDVDKVAASETISPPSLRPPADEVEMAAGQVPRTLVPASAGDGEGDPGEQGGDPAVGLNDDGAERTTRQVLASPKSEHDGRVRLGGDADAENPKTRKGSAAPPANGERPSDEGATGNGTVQGSFLSRSDDAAHEVRAKREAGAVGADQTAEERGDGKAGSVAPGRITEEMKASSEMTALEDPGNTLRLGKFEISPRGGSIPPGQSITVTVSFSPASVNTIHRETVVLQAYGSTTSAETLAKHRFYDLSAESCVPGIVTSDWRDVFEQQSVVPSLDEGGASPPAGEDDGGAGGAAARGPVANIDCSAEDVPVFSFGSVAFGEKPLGACHRFKVRNEKSVPCTVNFVVSTADKASPEQSKRTPSSESDKADVAAFAVHPTTWEIPPTSHFYVLVHFRPTERRSYRCQFGAVVPGNSDTRAGRLRFILAGEGTLPEEAFEDPRDKRGGSGTIDGDVDLDLEWNATQDPGMVHAVGGGMGGVRIDDCCNIVREKVKGQREWRVSGGRVAEMRSDN
eukprot:g5136.t1